jgi:predicted RNase H-like HicB family nuclease
MNLKIETEREEDGRWIAEVPDLPGVMCYGVTRADAVCKVEALALRTVADRIENGEPVPAAAEAFSIAA